MSYEITDTKNETVLPGKYSKIDEDDCQLLLQETSLDDETHVEGSKNDTEAKVSESSNSNLLEQNLAEGVESKPIQTENDNQNIESSTVTKSIPQTNKGDTKKSPKRTSSHRSFDISSSISSFIRFLSFRKKKNKSKHLDTSSISTSQDNSNDSPSSKRNKAKNEDASKTSHSSTKDDNDKPNVFYRFVRTFSFLYKRNPNSASNQNFKRSQSMQNYRPTRSLPNIKYPANQPRSLNSSVKQNVNSTKHSTVPTDQTTKRDRAKSDVPTANHTVQVNHVNVPELKSSVAHSISIPTETDSANKNVELKESHKKDTLKEVPQVFGAQSSTSNRRRHLVTSGQETPAVCGIQNHGNTCFINSVIQCLSNTDLLAEYFIFNHFREDLLHHKLMPKKYGTRGELTEHLAILLKSLWSCMYSSDISMKFKKIVSKHGEQYNGYEQHDAQEFLLWLLDKCHEDLTVQSPKSINKNSFLPFKKGFNKRTKKLNNDPLVTDEAAAIESLVKYQTVNSNSIIYDLFQGQLRSMVVCRNCDHYSKTFDPYLCLSLPVPIRLTLTIFIHAIFLEKERNSCGMFGISIEAAATLRDLRDKISRMLKIPEKRLILLQTDKKYGMIEFTNDTNMIQEIFEDFETIYALETPIMPVNENNSNQLIDIGESPANEPSNDMCQQMLTIVWLNRVGIGKEGPIFGSLFTTIVSRESTFRKLQSLILSTMSAYLIDKQNVDCDELSRNINLRLRVVSGLPGKEYLTPEVDHPLFVPTVESALSKTEDRRVYRGPYHLKIMVEWDLDIRRSILVSDDLIDAIDKNAMFIDKSVELAKECSNLNNRTTLQDCLDIYFREESLTADNAWMCPMCNSRQQCVKQLSVWTLPNIFIVHLKRFRYMSNVRRIKINTMVEYPQNGLDMLKYVAQRNLSSNADTVDSVKSYLSNGTSNCSKFSHQRKLHNSIEETTFNLYAVCCHHGTMQGGHYTAYCKNPVDNCWYLFDDTKVIPVLEETVVTADAYLLFYQKSSLNPTNMEPKANPSTSSISSGYLSSVTCSSNLNINHWAYQMPPFNYYNNGNNNGNGKSNTLPNRKVIQPNKVNTSANHNNNSNNNNNNNNNNSNSNKSNINSKTANYEGNKHSSTNYAQIQMNGNNKKVDQTVTNRSYSASNNYNNTFPRIKSRQASH